MQASDSSELKTALDRVWTENIELTRSRLAIVESAVIAALSRRLDAALATSAADAAHKLAGTLGSFGLSQGTTEARRLEELFESYVSANPMPEPELRARFESLVAIIASRA